MQDNTGPPGNMNIMLTERLEYLLRNGGGYDPDSDLGADVLDLIDAFLRKYIVYPNDYARQAHTLWIVHTRFMDVWQYTPRLLFLSPEPNCGKTSAMEITGHLVPRCPAIISDLTPAGLYYTIDESTKTLPLCSPTILYDELDTVFGPGHRDASEMRRLINSGHKREATLIRRIGKETTTFQLYAAMALAAKLAPGEVPDTIRTRSIVIPMRPRAPHEKVDRWHRRTGPAEAALLADLLALWCELVHGHAHEYTPYLPEQFTNRDADVWEPLLSVADLAGGHWPTTARVTAVTVVTAYGVRSEPSPGVRLLWDCKTVFDAARVRKMFTDKLLARLKDLDESPWRSLDSIKLAQLLKPYGVEPELQRIGGNVRRGYRRDYFIDAWSRYAKPVTPVTPVTGARRQSS